MKKIIILMMIMMSVGVCYANEAAHSAKTDSAGKLSFRMPDTSIKLSDDMDRPPFDPDMIRSVSIANRAVGIVMTSVSAVPFFTFIALSVITGFGIVPYISPVPVYGFQMTVAGIMMIYLGVKQSQYMRLKYDEPHYKYQMSRIMRNAGIIALGTSAVPLSITVPYIVLSFITNSYFLFPLMSIVNGAALAAQLAVGISFLVCGISRMSEWSEIISPEVSLSHDDKKGYDEGYSVNIGVRMKI